MVVVALVVKGLIFASVYVNEVPELPVTVNCSGAIAKEGKTCVTTKGAIATTHTKIRAE
jgi:hypothetical protein